MNSIVDLSSAMTRLYGSTVPGIQQLLQQLQPHVGDYKMSAETDDRLSWFMCDGRSLSRQDYADIFRVIGTSFGSDSADTFKLPDFRGRIIGQPGRGVGLTARAMGDVVGSETHVLSAAELPSHTHTGTTNTTGGHAHTATAASDGAHAHGITDPGHTHTQTTINDDFNSSGTTPPGFAADSAGSRTWNNISNATTGITVNSGGAHTHSLTVQTNGDHSHTFTTSSVGSGGAHNNMQPTLFGANMFIWVGAYNVSPNVE
jgi:microcystin-dependent protein